MVIKIGRKEIVWSYLGYILNNGVNLILMPFVLKFLPANELGLWYTFLSVGGMVNLLDFGFLPTITRNFTFCWSGANKLSKTGVNVTEIDGQPNYKLLYLIIKASRLIYLIIGIIALSIMLSIGTYYIVNILADNIEKKYIIAWIIYSIAVFLNLFYGYWRAALKGVGLVKESQQSILYARITQIIISLVCLFSGLGIIGVAIAYLISGVVSRQLSMKYFYNNNIKEKLIYKLNRIELLERVKEIFGIIWHNAWRTGMFSVGTFLTTQSSTLIVSRYLGLEATASYGLAFQMFNMLYACGTIFFSTYMIKMNEARIQKDMLQLKKAFSVSLVISWGTYILGALTIILISEPIVKLLGSNTKMLPRIILLFMAIDMFLDFNYNKFVSFILTGNKVPFYKSSIATGICVISLSFLLVNYTNLGVWGVLISHFLCQSIYNYWYWPKVVIQELDIKLIDILRLGLGDLLRIIKIIA